MYTLLMYETIVKCWFTTPLTSYTLYCIYYSNIHVHVYCVIKQVIYALNTKNDEHEQIVKVLQQQHDKEKHQLMSEVNSKLESLRNKLGR